MKTPLMDQENASSAALLALEEALLDFCESNRHPGFLTFWESPTYFVVLGYGKRLAEEVFETECAERTIPVLRRSSGGGTVLQGPGCFNYTLVLRMDCAPELETITGANRYIMEKNRSSLARLVPGHMTIQGHTDLTIDGLKFSGNAQRRKRTCLLFHGSFLLNFDLSLISKTLRLPRQQPEYRNDREHGQFITNLRVDSTLVQSALVPTWNATEQSASFQEEILKQARVLTETKYARDDWNRRF